MFRLIDDFILFNNSYSWVSNSYVLVKSCVGECIIYKVYIVVSVKCNVRGKKLYD